MKFKNKQKLLSELLPQYKSEKELHELRIDGMNVLQKEKLMIEKLKQKYSKHMNEQPQYEQKNYLNVP